MSSSTQALDTVLQQLKTYRYVDSVKLHVSHLISMLPSLSPTIGTINVGKKKKSSLCLQGTIPVYYKGNRYNIPINIWLSDDYPYRAPLVNVTPTESMSIKVGHRNVDSTGKCSIRYLTEWNVRTHTLYELVNHLSAAFGADPPVFQKPVAQQPQAQHRPSSYGYAHPQHQQYPPASAASQYQPQTRYQQPTPQSQYHQAPVPHTQYQQHQQYPQHLQQQHQHQPYPHQTQQSRHLPPPPSNPELKRRELNGKINRAMQTFLKDFVQKMEQEMDSQAKLNARANILSEQERKLTEDHENFKEDIRSQTEKIENMKKWINENKDVEIDIDNVINPNGIHAKQILECVAEDIAIDDLFYNLDKALQNDVITLEVYLKNVRKYSRIQFEKRALAKKIHSLQQGSKR